MKILVTGTPGSGKTTLVKYANNQGDGRFFDADEIVGLCEWREFKTGNVLGLVTDHKETGQDDWYVKYGWYWKYEFLEKFLDDNTSVILCGSSENMDDCYALFDKIIFLKKTEAELISNLESPDRNNPFGKTPKQRANFLSWQDFIINAAKPFDNVLIQSNDIDKVYGEVIKHVVQ